MKYRDLIPGLPEELALECLVRVPFEFHSSIKSVCKSWRSLIFSDDGEFMNERRRFGKDESLLCFVQPLTSPPSSPIRDKEKDEEGSESYQSQTQTQPQTGVIGTPLYGLSVYNKTLSTWHRIAIPERIPLFCECVAIQNAGKLLLIGGWDPETLQPVRDVFILDFSGGGRRWKRGKPMSAARSFFACASVGSSKVYVAGGHDDQKNALRSAEVYDVEEDEWITIAPMNEGRDECHGLTAETTDLGFCVLSGYGTETQGQFRSDAEIYDPISNSWSIIENVWPFHDLSPRGRTAAVESAGDGGSVRIWCFVDSERQTESSWKVEDDLGRWKVVMEAIKLPVTTMSSVFAGRLSGEAVAMIGGGEEGGTMMMTTEKNGGKWSGVDTPCGFSSLPFSYSSIYV